MKASSMAAAIALAVLPGLIWAQREEGAAKRPADPQNPTSQPTSYAKVDITEP